MNKRLLVGVGAGAAVAALILWFVLGRGHDKAKAPAAGPAVTQPGPRPGPGGDRPGRGGDDRGGGEAAVLVDDDPVGALRLEGQVIDGADQPVGGATVVLSSNPPRVVTTEGDGSFVFDALVGRAYQVAARAPGGVAGPVTVRLTANTDQVTLKLHAASTVVVEVVDDHGAPVDGATVELRDLDTQAATTVGGKATITPVVPGGYQVAAWAPGFARAYSWINVNAPTETERIALKRGAAVSGRVVSEAGAPIAGARVLYSGASDWSQQPDERLDSQVTDASGAFHFDAIAVGSWRFDATHPDHAPGSSAIVTLDGQTPVEDVTITMPAGATVSGVVVDAAHAPVASAQVRIGGQRASFASGPPRQVFSGADGTFTVRGLPLRPLRAVAVSDAGASATTDVDASKGDVSNVQLVIDVTGTIAGEVVDAAGEPLEGVQVSAFPDFRKGNTGGDFSQWRLRGFPQDLTDAGGHFTLVGLQPGDYRVRASRTARRGRGGGRRGPGGPDGVAAKTGDTAVKIVLPEDGGVKGKVAFADGTVPAAFTVGVDFDAQPFASKDGAFELDDLAPQDYEVEIRGNGFQAKTVKATVEAGKIVDVGTVTVTKGRTIRGVVTANGAPVAGATVYAGGQIFGNGTSNNAGMGGPPGAGSTKTATTAEDGSFTIAGFGKRTLTVIAEEESLGRSKAIRVVAGDPAEEHLEIALQPFGALTGTVTDGGAVQEGTIVSVQSTTAPGAMYGVSSGADGTFRLDRLAPDSYKVSAMTGMNPMRGMGFYSNTVTVPGGGEVHVDVAIQRGTITLEVAPKAGDKPVIGYMWIASGTITARNGGDLDLKLAAQPDQSFSNFKVITPMGPPTFTELTAGAYTVCVLPMPSELAGDMRRGFGYVQEHGDDLPAFCKPVTVAAAPDKQTLEIDVEIPALIPDE